METPSSVVVALTALALPAWLVGVGLLAPRRAEPATRAAAIGALLVAFGVWAAPEPIALGVRLDRLTCLLLLLATGLGTVIVRYSGRYLEGEPGRVRAMRWLLFTLAAVSALASSNSLLVIAVAWTTTSLTMQPLLTFESARPAAVLAAHKKFLVSRLADIALTGSLVLIHSTVGSLEIDRILHCVDGADRLPASMDIAACLLVAAVALRSAQLPFHGWITQVMEAPTPVSALMHAGVVNIGGFVLIRLAPWLSRSESALDLLTAIGLSTAFLASLIMTTRVSVKLSLAWSTCAQMGFMLVECGLGLWSMAALHLVAHSLYKAHAFLSAGSTVDEWRRHTFFSEPSRPSIARQTVSMAVGLTLAFVAITAPRPLLGLPPLGTLPALVLTLLLGLSLVPSAVSANPRMGVSLLAHFAQPAMLVVAYSAWHVFADYMLPSAHVPDGLHRWGATGATLVLLFGVRRILEWQPRGGLARALHPWLFAGLYLDELFTRLTFRIWPPRAACSTPDDARRRASFRSDPGGGGPNMTARTTASARSPEAPPSLEATVEAACGRIAPTWPLDRFIAVNPFWELVGSPLPEVASRLRSLSGADLLMPRAYFRKAYQRGILRNEHLQTALEAAGDTETLGSLRALLEEDEPPPRSRRCAADVIDSVRDLGHAPSWRSFIRQSISQACASYFDDGQASFRPPDDHSLFLHWRTQAQRDLSPRLLMQAPHYRGVARALPPSASAMITMAVESLGIAPEERESYLWSLLLDINGWASWCSYRRWTARLEGRRDDTIVDLLAIRIGWEWLLQRLAGDAFTEGWRSAMGEWRATDLEAAQARRRDWLLQEALEIAYRERILQTLPVGLAAPRPESPAVQAVFCIDVRSEGYRRALEATTPSIQTLGFAGFFGLPLEYEPLGAQRPRPHLPGLLPPSLRATDSGFGDRDLARRAQHVAALDTSRSLKRDPLSTFAFVESFGVQYAIDLFKAAFGGAAHRDRDEVGLGPDAATRRAPRLVCTAGGEPLDTASRATLALNMLRGMSLTRDFARIVLLVGHGSATRNNPHAAGLDCGACGGQTGEVSARAAAALLNDPSVRSQLREHGVSIPEATFFIPALHNTTTDELVLHDLDQTPGPLQADLANLARWLEDASRRARRERSAALGLSSLDDATLARAVEARTRDWSQVRPEWGLANNAALIVAPREHSKHLSLEGRAFLHEYRHSEDPEYAVLELIMTAPLVVAHWINLQYYASTVDNLRYGSGNKLLHNVVGGHIGVFEGNTGDLRVGLPLQSVHDGTEWAHAPLRLSVFIEAPRDAIEAIMRKHRTVRALVQNAWLSLFQLDEGEAAVYAYRGGRWERIPRDGSKGA